MTLHHTLFRTSLCLIMASSLTACFQEASSEEPAKAWSVSTASKDAHFNGVLNCDKAPFVGDFQSCHLELTQSGKVVDDASLSIDGGMKAHGHGLPTAPKVVAQGAGKYTIEGLKFSMTGTWTVGFLIKANGLSDQLIFDFNI